MTNQQIGNRITDNALSADDGVVLIKSALEFINQKFVWKPEDKPLFSGVYYDATKVGSYITKVYRSNETAVLKLQLRPLPFDEGFIIRHIEKENRSSLIQMPKILEDKPWHEEKKFGYLIFEDLSFLPDLWTTARNITPEEKNSHKLFLKEYLHNLLPVTPFLPKPKILLREKLIESYNHFQTIAAASQHHHIEADKVKKMKDIYFNIINTCHFEDIHFAHGHLSGLDIKFNSDKNIFTPLANLYWSYRPKYYELTFPIWVNIMHQIREDISFDEVKKIVSDWTELWATELFETPPDLHEQYWFNLLERAVLTVMLDLGASRWEEKEIAAKKKLLAVWEEIFYWIASEKFSH